MNWKNVRLVFLRELRDQLRDRRTLFMVTILPLLLYPMLGLGMVEILLTVSGQRQTIVILNADQIPHAPSLLDESGIAPEWLPEGSADLVHLRVVTDSRRLRTGIDGGFGEADKLPTSRHATGRQQSDELEADKLLATARQLYATLLTLRELEVSDTREMIPEPSAVQPALPAGELSDRAYFAHSPPAGSHEENLHQVRTRLQQLFATSGIQVLIVFPEHFSSSLDALQARAGGTDDAAFLNRREPVLVIRNSAIDKSAAAFSYVMASLENWEQAVQSALFTAAGLPQQLQYPACIKRIEIAESGQIAASVWSKLFPAMLVIMALTGAFYPAIDLGAGEKERGTMETLLISPARRVELVLGKFATVMLFSVCTALLNLISMGMTGRHLSMVMAGRERVSTNLELPGAEPLFWLLVLLFPLAALFSALCLALATFARSTKEGHYYLTPLLMVVMGLTIFCMTPSVEITPLYSIFPVMNVALLLKGLLLIPSPGGNLVAYTIPVLISSLGYSILALWWAIDLYSREDVLFREAEKLDVRLWLRQVLRTKDAVPAFPEAVFCFVLILILQFLAMSWMQPDLSSPNAGRRLLQVLVTQQLVMIACPAVFMGVLLTTSLRATFRLRKPTWHAMGLGVGLALVAHPLSVELSQFLVSHQVFPPLPEGAVRVMEMLQAEDQPIWLLIVVFALTPAICEELAFRGFILSGLARGGRLGIAVVISSLMFGIIHMIPQQAFNAALLGLILGLLAVYSRSLFPAIAFHFVNNAVATLHARGPSVIGADGVFFSRDADGGLRYEAPLLILCGVAAFLMILHMSRFVIREQDRKRRGLIPSYQPKIREKQQPA